MLNMKRKNIDIVNEEPETESVSVEEVISESVEIPRSKKRGFKKWSFLIVFILAVIGICMAVYYSHQYYTLKANPNIEAEREIASLVSAVSKLMDLPVDETPTVITIVDKEKLTDQSFFARAENGDKLLAYSKAMQAILYRPSVNRIINVAPIFDNQAQDLTASETKIEAVATSSTKKK